MNLKRITITNMKIPLKKIAKFIIKNLYVLIDIHIHQKNHKMKMINKKKMKVLILLFNNKHNFKLLVKMMK